MPTLSSIRSRFLLVYLSIFYDVAFVDRVWTDPNFMRATLSIAGIFLTAIVGLAYSIGVLFFSVNLQPVADAFILLGVLLFVLGSWGGRIDIGLNLAKAQETLASRGTVLCILSDTKQSSSFIEALMVKTQDQSSENHLNVSECNLVFATEIWGESLAKKGINLLGEVSASRKKGDLSASKDNLPPV